MNRPADHIREHYEIERKLADQLRRATREERMRLFPRVYDELFDRVPDHPQLTGKEEPSLRARQVKRRLRSLRRFLTPTTVYLELGVGDAALALAVASNVAKVYGIDVSKRIIDGVSRPANVELLLSDGLSVPVPERSVNVAFSDQLIEHLHPDDVLEQLADVRRALVPSGRYVLLTPNRLSGPHDISRGFDEAATGFHLREYTNEELRALLCRAGFSNVRRAFASSQRFHLEYPLGLVILLERLLRSLGRPGRRLARAAPVAFLLGCRVIAQR